MPRILKCKPVQPPLLKNEEVPPKRIEVAQNIDQVVTLIGRSVEPREGMIQFGDFVFPISQNVVQSNPRELVSTFRTTPEFLASFSLRKYMSNYFAKNNPQTVERFEKVKLLDLSATPEISLTKFRRIVFFFPNIISLNVMGCDKLTAKAFEYLACFKKLTELNLTNCSWVTEKEIEDLIWLCGTRGLCIYVEKEL